MLEPLKQWVCDECGDIINGPDQGYLEWLATDDGKSFRYRGFRIVHHAPRSPRRPEGNCYRYTSEPGRMDMSLDTYVGSDGLPALLMMFVDVGSYHQPEYLGPKADVREWVELFKRLQLPFYEEARRYWERAEADNFFDGGNEVWIYLPKTLREVITKYEHP